MNDNFKTVLPPDMELLFEVKNLVPKVLLPAVKALVLQREAESALTYGTLQRDAVLSLALSCASFSGELLAIDSVITEPHLEGLYDVLTESFREARKEFQGQQKFDA